MQSDMFAMAFNALALLLEPSRLLILFIGVLIGLAIGVLPGLSGIVGMALLIPFTYHMDPPSAFALLLGMASVITSSDFITAILFGVPGHVGAAATVIDGHAMARKGEAGRAFGAGFTASLMGGLVGAAVLFFSIPVLRPIMLQIGSPELLGFTLFGMSMVATLSGRAPLKGLAAAGLGLMISMIGSKAQGGTLRWTFGTEYLYDGLPLVPVTLGVFALPELAELSVLRKRIAGNNDVDISLSSQWRGVRDVLDNWWLVVRCSLLGTGLGAIPGIGSAVIDWIAYGYAQRTEKNAETFGTGDVRGVIAPEASNNAKEGGHLVPTIAFGVPAGASMALLLGAFLIHGLTPGPEMLTKHLNVTYTIVWSLTLGHVLGAIICLCGSSWLAKVARVPPDILLPIVLSLVMIAAYEGSHDFGDLIALLSFGVLGWFMKRLGWPRPPLVLGFVVGSIFERYLFISLELFGWEWIFRPIVMGIFVMIFWALFRPMVQIGKSLIADWKAVKVHHMRFNASVGFSLVFSLAVLVSLISTQQWPYAAKIVPATACAFALVAVVLNLVTEIFGSQARVSGGAVAEGGVQLAAHGHHDDDQPDLFGPRAIGFYAWLLGFIVCVFMIGFLPSVLIFVFCFMRFGFERPLGSTTLYAVGTTLFCYLVFHRLLHVAWPESELGDFVPYLRATGLL